MAMLPTTLAIALLATGQAGDTAPSVTIGISEGGLPTSGPDMGYNAGPNQGAAIASVPERHRLPPVRLAKHEETDVADESGAAPRRLPRPGTGQSSSESQQSITPTSSLFTVGTSLAVVLGLFFAATWFMRRTAPRGSLAAPEEVLEVLGRVPLPGKQQLQVVRFGSKLVLLAATPDGVEAVSEITNPDEVQQMTALCRHGKTGSSSQAFQEILNQMGREPARGFLDQPAVRTVPTRR